MNAQPLTAEDLAFICAGCALCKICFQSDRAAIESLPHESQKNLHLKCKTMCMETALKVKGIKKIEEDPKEAAAQTKKIVNTLKGRKLLHLNPEFALSVLVHKKLQPRNIQLRKVTDSLAFQGYTEHIKECVLRDDELFSVSDWDVASTLPDSLLDILTEPPFENNQGKLFPHQLDFLCSPDNESLWKFENEDVLLLFPNSIQQKILQARFGEELKRLTAPPTPKRDAGLLHNLEQQQPSRDGFLAALKSSELITSHSGFASYVLSDFESNKKHAITADELCCAPAADRPPTPAALLLLAAVAAPNSHNNSLPPLPAAAPVSPSHAAIGLSFEHEDDPFFDCLQLLHSEHE